MRSQRLSIGAMSEKDETLYCELFTDPVTMCHIGAPLTMEVAKRRFRGALTRARLDPPAGLLFSFADSATGRPIGIGALENIDRVRSRAEVGIMLCPAWQGRGLGTEALRMLLKTAFVTLDIGEVWGQFDPSHVAVERMNTRAGMGQYGLCSDYGARPGMRIQRVTRVSLGM